MLQAAWKGIPLIFLQTVTQNYDRLVASSNGKNVSWRPDFLFECWSYGIWFCDLWRRGYSNDMTMTKYHKPKNNLLNNTQELSHKP
jgi:hypothetical protein